MKQFMLVLLGTVILNAVAEASPVVTFDKDRAELIAVIHAKGLNQSEDILGGGGLLGHGPIQCEGN